MSATRKFRKIEVVSPAWYSTTVMPGLSGVGGPPGFMMIHGCHIGRGSIVVPSAIVCDGSVVGAESVVRAGACVKQRDRFGDRLVLDGFPARLIGTLTGPPPMPGWALPPDAVVTLRRVQR